MGHSGNSPHSLLGSTGASAPSDCKMSKVQCPSPPLPRADCPGTGANQSGHQGHSRKPSSLPAASPSTLGDQIYVMVKGLAGPGSQIRAGAHRALLRLSRGRATHSVASNLPSTRMLLKEKKVLFFPSCSKCSGSGCLHGLALNRA